MNKLISPVRASEILDIDIDSVYRFARLGVIPVVKIGRRIKFSEDQLHEFIKNGGKSYKN